MSNQRHTGGDEPQRPRKKKKKNRRWILYTFFIVFGLIVGVGGWATNFVYQAYQTLPAFEEYDPSQTSVILDNQGKEVYRLAAEENRTPIKDINQIPRDVRNAFVATEDHRFYEHFGVDIYRMFGAVWSSAKYFAGMKGSQLEGGSTITMQLSRNAFLTLDQNMNRKVQEMMIAIELERKYTKDEILLMYLNHVSFGYQASGLEAASQTYLSKSAKDLTISEAAMLAGMLKAPSTYNPFDNYEGAMKRRSIVLDLMVQHGYLDKAKAEEIRPQKVEVKRAKVTPTSVTFPGDWYVDYVIKVLSDPNVAARYGTPVFDSDDLYSKGLKIYTALDQKHQKIAQEKMQEIMPAATKEYGGKEVPEAAVVVMNHTTGEVKALVGGMAHKQMLGYNRATQAYRQPGSSIKPIVAYLPAIDLLGWGPATVVDDSPPRLNQDRDDVWPKNYEFRYQGLLPLRTGLEQSINSMAVRALEAVTPREAIKYAHKMGLTTIKDAQAGEPNDQNLALALGGLTVGVTPLDMTAAYGVLGNMGVKVDPVVITKIENKHGEIIYQATPQKKQVLNRDSTWMMVDIMKGSILRGTAYGSSRGFKGWPAAGKTGTTEDWHDAWFLGFTPEIVTGVWTGYDNDNGRKSLPGAGTGWAWTGAGPPTRIWTAIMTEIVTEKPKDWERPPGIVMVEVCKTSGMLPSPLCPKEDLGSDWFRKGFEPKQADNVWTLAQVVNQPALDPKTNQLKDNWLLWQEGCGIAETKLFIKRPTTYAKHPKTPDDPKNLPADRVKEVPTQTCNPSAQPPIAPPLTPLPGSPVGPGNPPPGSNPGGANSGGLLPPILPGGN